MYCCCNCASAATAAAAEFFRFRMVVKSMTRPSDQTSECGQDSSSKRPDLREPFLHDLRLSSRLRGEEGRYPIPCTA